MKSLNNQKGASLLLTLIVLAAFLVSTVALMKTTSTSAIVSGNIAFKEAATHAADVGIAEAIRTIRPCGTPAVNPCGKANDATYVIQSMQPTSYFLTKSNWSLATAKTANLGAAGANPGYTVQYIVDRMSTGLTNPQDSEDVRLHSLGIIAKDSSPSNDYSEQGTANTLLSVPAVYYRITVRVTGASNTEYISQAAVTVATN